MEFGAGARREQNRDYMRQLRAMRVLASDMETSHLFVLSDAHSTEVAPISQPPSPTGVVRSGSLLAIVGDESPYATHELISSAEDTAIQVAIRAAFALSSSTSGLRTITSS